MAENESLTPEKQLLKLIENPKPAAVRAASVKREGKKWISFAAFKGRLDFWKNFSVKNWFSLKSFTKSSHGIKQINFVIRILLAAAVIYTAYNIWEMTMGLRKASNLILSPDKGTPETTEPLPVLRSISYYLEKIKGRNIFSPGEPPKAAAKLTEDGKPVAAEGDVTKDISLVGIAWSDDPEAMIEDKKTGRTFFVKRGQAVSDGIRVVTVFRDKVVLNYQDKEFELS